MRERGFDLKTPESLGSRHVAALTQLWAEQNLSAGTLHTRLSRLNTFSGWIGKKGIVKKPHEHFPPEKCRRTSVRKKDRSWESMGIDPLEVIERARQIDERVALYLSLQYHLGLRAKESLEFHPAKALSGQRQRDRSLRGHKGGLAAAYPHRAAAAARSARLGARRGGEVPPGTHPLARLHL
ncbi:MAG: integrase domain-containing protein [Comamonadaceae bacterium]|nr:integrase domain-containing protein [Comamonadaceae bacterium]